MPQTVLAQGQADFAIAWVPKALASREQGAQITDVGPDLPALRHAAGVLQGQGHQPARPTCKGKKVGNWGFGNEYELFAGMTEAGLDPAKDVTLVQQQFDMQALLKGDIDAAQAMTYNEYAQVLEAKNPATGKLYQPARLHRDQLERRRHRDAPGRGLGEHREAGERHGVPGHHGQVPDRRR